MKNTTKKLVLNLEDDEIYKRSPGERLKLQEFMAEIGQLAHLKICLPTELVLANSLFEILKEVQSFVGIEFDEMIYFDTFDFIVRKYILGVDFSTNNDEYCQLKRKINFEMVDSFVRNYMLTIKTWQSIDQLVKTLTPAWPNLKYFYTKCKFNIFRYQLFTDINLCLPFIAQDRIFNFDLKETKILQKLARNQLRNENHVLMISGEVYADRMGSIWVSRGVPFNCNIEYMTNGSEISSLPDNSIFFFIVLTEESISK